jgi:hypothetical protein
VVLKPDTVNAAALFDMIVIDTFSPVTMHAGILWNAVAKVTVQAPPVLDAPDVITPA